MPYSATEALSLRESLLSNEIIHPLDLQYG